MSQELKPVVIYHKGCADGVAAAWCFWKEFGDSMEYHQGVYGAPVPDIYQRDVYLVDFSYKRDIVQMMCQYAKSVTLLDHHKSALEDLWDLASKFENFDMDFCTESKSGAIIAWDYVKTSVKHRRKMPELLRHVQDRDLWKFELKHTREIMAYVFSNNLTIEMFESLTKMSLRLAAKEGTAILRAHSRNVESIAKQCARPMFIGDRVVTCVNSNGMFASDIGSLLSAEDDQSFIASYFDTESARVFSLRSCPGTGVDVSKIAAQYGGGGHKHAAGFKVPRHHDLAKV